MHAPASPSPIPTGTLKLKGKAARRVSVLPHPLDDRLYLVTYRISTRNGGSRNTTHAAHRSLVTLDARP
jgi:hypothetical protein